ncbi:hypothetical protein RF11_11955 [Thelohanellus kitauei]|uniref:ISXO2-like transposase domain-containing protein n=1 Tax=Thelohanellus kitauei TaxID=669202 RepID=A0A0C2JAK4_THEKT|nr:hypothetical protein RF11_11955 [Thelohanellus kitauei]
MLSYFWLSSANNKQIETYTGHCKSTVTHYKTFLRPLVSDRGENVIVEIDETKMGKNKHHRGHSVDGAWVLGGVERTEEHRVFLVYVSDRTEATLLGIIRTYVLPLSIIMTIVFCHITILTNSILTSPLTIATLSRILKLEPIPIV